MGVQVIFLGVYFYWLTLGFCSEINTLELNNPIIKIINNEDIFVGTDKHIITLKLDLDAINHDFDKLENISLSLWESLASNMWTDTDPKIQFDIQGKSKLKADGLWEMLDEALGIIKIENKYIKKPFDIASD